MEKKDILVTGDRPTGNLHLGHYVGTLENRIKLQNQFDCFFLIADLHMLTTHNERVDELRLNIESLVIDWISVGLDPNNSCFYLQSLVPEINELTLLLSMICSVSRVQRIPTLKEKTSQLGDKENYSVGLLSYPILMSADILIFNAKKVPVGEDQLSHVELARELSRRFNSLYGHTITEPEPLISEFSRLVGIDGKSKMSKSLNNCIYLIDNQEVVSKKVMKMFTDPNRTSPDIPGKVEGNPVFIYHDIFNQNKSEVDEFKDRYKKGKIGDVEIKKSLAKSLNLFLEPIRERRSQLKKNRSEIFDIIIDGSTRARKLAKENIDRIKDSMKINFKEI